MFNINQQALVLLIAQQFPNQLKINQPNEQFQWKHIEVDHQLFKLHHLLNWLPLISVLFSILLTQGLLSLSQNEPLNLMLIFVLLVCMPWLIFVVIRLIKMKLPKSNSVNLDVLQFQSKFISYLNAQHSLIFALISFVCIWLNLLLNDIPIGWSSSFDLSPQQLSQYASYLSFVWNSWFESATLSVEWFEQNQFFVLQNEKNITGINSLSAWKFLLMAMIFYSILPRLLFFIYAYFKLHRSIQAWIKWQWPLMQQEKNQSNSIKHNKEKVNIPVKSFSLEEFDQVLSWQYSQPNITELGVNNWQEDVQLMQGVLQSSNKNIAVLVDARMAPVSELEDLLLMLKKDSSIKVTLLIISVPAKSLREGLVYSWQEFAKKLSIVCYQTDEIK